MEEIRRQVRETIAGALRLTTALDALGDDDDLIAHLGVDSVGFLEILMALEEAFDVRILDASATRQSVGTVRKLAELVIHAREMEASKP